MLCEVTSAKHAVLYEVTSAKHAWVSLKKMWVGQMSKLKEKLAAALFVLTALFSIGLFNVLQEGGVHGDPPPIELCLMHVSLVFLHMFFWPCLVLHRTMQHGSTCSSVQQKETYSVLYSA